ncbi:MAG: chorismate mutase [Chloroflexi bacterium]|nr:chorismate mutase [Chloroflexota bacterium]
MSLRGIRGATTSNANTREAILDATRELLDTIARRNDLHPDDVVSAVFTVTPDLDAAFPAAAARQLGWTHTALLDMLAPRVPTDLSRCIRVMIHWNTERSPHEVRHVYLRDARKLRPDWATITEEFPETGEAK